MKFALVTTTVNIPMLLEDYCKNFKENGHHDVEIIVIGDKKTPIGASDFCTTLSSKFGYIIEYYDEKRQNSWLKRHSGLAEHLPWNSIQRRNIGYLVAYERNNDVIISIDDDNYVIEQDYLSPLYALGQVVEAVAVESSSGWYNICEELSTEDKRLFYPRGFPYSKRWLDEDLSFAETRGTLAVQAGLWMGDPDIDAVTRLEKPVEVVDVSERALQGIVLGKKTFCPFNTQNTAIHRSVVPAWFMSPYIGRFDDIWASYMIIHIADHLNDKIAFGRPIVRQARNDHDLVVDLKLELFGMQYTDAFTEMLSGIYLKGSNYLECYEELFTGFSNSIKEINKNNKKNIGKFEQLVKGMGIWIETVKAL